MFIERTTPEDANALAWLRACRERLGSAPRSLKEVDIRAGQLTLDPFMKVMFQLGRDPLLEILKQQRGLLERGQIVWAHLIQANNQLFDPQNDKTLPANIVYSQDPFFDGRPGLLWDIARGLMGLKGESSADRTLDDFVRVLTSETERLLRQELPRPYCGNRSVQFATCFIQPGHLPGNCLKRTGFPALIHPAATEAVMLLPARFWPADLIAQWEVDPATVYNAPLPELAVEPSRSVARPSPLKVSSRAAQKVREVLAVHGWQYLRVELIAHARNDHGLPDQIRPNLEPAEKPSPDEYLFETAGLKILMNESTAWWYENARFQLDYVEDPGGPTGFRFVELDKTR